MVIAKILSTAVTFVFTTLVCLTISFAGIPEPCIIFYGKVLDENGHLLTSGELSLTLTNTSNQHSVMKTTHLREIQDNEITYSYALLIPIETGITGYPVSEDAIARTNNPALYKRSAKIKNKAISITDSIQISYEKIGSVLNFLISKDGDADHDGLPDAWEQQIIYYNASDLLTLIAHVNPDGDFDNDGISNMNEFNYQTNPTDPDDPGFGDVNGDCKITLDDAVICLEVICNSLKNALFFDNNANDNESLSIKNVIFILRYISDF